MSTELTIGDVFDMAMQIERDADSFYRSAAAVAGGAGRRKVLLDLAAMEREHELVFAGMKERLGSHAQSPARIGGKDGGKSLSVVNLLPSGVGEDLRERFTGRESSEEILQKAIEFEKDTVVFFAGMKNALPDPAERDKLDSIIREELGHIVYLTSILALSKSE